MPAPRRPALLLAAAALVALPPSASALTVELLETPEVVVANEPGDVFQNPNYPFTATARIANDDEPHNVTVHAITYIDQDVDGCPTSGTDHPPPRIFLVQKQKTLAAGESVTIGGSTDASQANRDPDAYWPLAVSKTYRDRDGNNVSYAEGTHSFCVVAIDTDCAAQSRQLRQCTLDRAAFEAYVRRDNQPPAITDVSVRPGNPRVGQTTLLSAEAVDNSTQPRQDTLTYAWKVRADTLRGSSVRHAFASEEVHEVTLEVSDGFDVVNRTVRVPVGNASLEEDGGGNPTPGPGSSALALLAAAALLSRRIPAS